VDLLWLCIGHIGGSARRATLFQIEAYSRLKPGTDGTFSDSYSYDQLNRLTQKSHPDTTTVNYTYDNDSRLTQVTDPTGTYQFTFDNMGRLTGTSTQYAFLTSRSFTTSYGYDADSNRTSFTDPENGSSSYVYDTLNRLQTLLRNMPQHVIRSRPDAGPLGCPSRGYCLAPQSAGRAMPTAWGGG
jgi:YD repeat-containing protein